MPSSMLMQYSCAICVPGLVDTGPDLHFTKGIFLFLVKREGADRDRDRKGIKNVRDRIQRKLSVMRKWILCVLCIVDIVCIVSFRKPRVVYSVLILASGPENHFL